MSAESADVGLRGWIARWWAGEAGAIGRAANLILWPAEMGYRGITGVRNRAFDVGLLGAEQVDVPVISVGNLAVGGTGKTPFTAWIARRLRAMGKHPAVLLRGYGADEVLLHRELNPCVPVHAAARRADAAAAAVRAGADSLVLDDGFQHRRLARELDLVLISAEGWGDQHRLLPRGPWREGTGALRRADLLVLTRKIATDADTARVHADLSSAFPELPIVEVKLVPAGLRYLHIPDGELIPLSTLAHERVLAVAALAAPALFAAQLREKGAKVELAAFPDHHPFSATDARALLRRAGDRRLIMTGKDATKLRALLPPDANAQVFEQRVEIAAGREQLEGALREILEKRP